VVSSIATWKDKPFLKELESALGQPLPRLQVGSVEPYEELRTHRPTGDLRKGKTKFRRKL
jgi:hypothetical protein